MLLESDTPRCFIEITRGGDDWHFTVKASLGPMSLENDYLVFEAPALFLERFKLLELRREGRALLEGTEDFRLSFEPDGGSGALWAQFYLERNRVGARRRQGGHHRSDRARLEGGFSIPGERVTTVCRAFEALFTGAKGYSGTVDLRPRRGADPEGPKPATRGLLARLRAMLEGD